MQILATKASSIDNEDSSLSKDEFNKCELPPMYVDIQEEIERNLTDANSILSQLKKLQAQRLKISFDTDEKSEQALQNKIFDRTREVTTLIKMSEKDLKKLRDSDSDTKADEQIKTNITSTLASKLKDVTMRFKQSEKEHYIKVKDFHGDDDQDKKKKDLDDKFFQGQLQQQTETMSLQHKDEEIQSIVKSINDLAGIFKDLSVLVVE